MGPRAREQRNLGPGDCRRSSLPRRSPTSSPPFAPTGAAHGGGHGAGRVPARGPRPLPGRHLGGRAAGRLPARWRDGRGPTPAPRLPSAAKALPRRPPWRANLSSRAGRLQARKPGSLGHDEVTTPPEATKVPAQERRESNSRSQLRESRFGRTAADSCGRTRSQLGCLDWTGSLRTAANVE